VVRLYGLSVIPEQERRLGSCSIEGCFRRVDLGAWAALSSAGRFELRAQVPADISLGPLRLRVRLEEQGGLEGVEEEVRAVKAAR
jgi:hypothetical protein